MDPKEEVNDIPKNNWFLELICMEELRRRLFTTTFDHNWDQVAYLTVTFRRLNSLNLIPWGETEPLERYLDRVVQTSKFSYSNFY